MKICKLLLLFICLIVSYPLAAQEKSLFLVKDERSVEIIKRRDIKHRTFFIYTRFSADLISKNIDKEDYYIFILNKSNPGFTAYKVKEHPYPIIKTENSEGKGAFYITQRDKSCKNTKELDKKVEELRKALKAKDIQELRYEQFAFPAVYIHKYFTEKDVVLGFDSDHQRQFIYYIKQTKVIKAEKNKKKLEFFAPYIAWSESPKQNVDLCVQVEKDSFAKK